MDLRQNNAPSGDDTAGTKGAETPNVRVETFQRIRRSLLTTRLALAEDVSGVLVNP